MMKAWIYQGRICTILPMEADPEIMGEIYDIDRWDSEALEEAEQLVRHAQRNLDNLHRGVIAKITRK